MASPWAVKQYVQQAVAAAVGSADPTSLTMRFKGAWDAGQTYAPGQVVRNANGTWMVTGSASMPAGVVPGQSPNSQKFKGYDAFNIESLGTFPVTVTGSSPLMPLYGARAAQRVSIAAFRVVTGGTLTVEFVAVSAPADTELALYALPDETTPILTNDDQFSSAAGLNAQSLTPGVYVLVGSAHVATLDGTGTYNWVFRAPSTAVLGAVVQGGAVDAAWQAI